MKIPSPVEIDVQSVKRLLDEQADFLLLDCREPDEWKIARLEEARLVPMNELLSRLEELEEFRDRKIVVHCHLGGRSLQVVHWLRARGFHHSQNMTGGIDRWSLLVDSQIPRY